MIIHVVLNAFYETAVIRITFIDGKSLIFIKYANVCGELNCIPANAIALPILQQNENPCVELAEKLIEYAYIRMMQRPIVEKSVAQYAMNTK